MSDNRIQSQQNPDDNSGKPIFKGRVPFPQRDSVTSIQVGVLLNIQSVMLTALLNAHQDQSPDDPKLDGGAQSSACVTFMKACDCLDSIIEDKSRWTLEAQDLLETKLAEVYDGQVHLLKRQSEAAKEVVTPHFRYNPRILKLLDGSYAAVLGDLADIDNAIVGVGVTPKQALEAFDGMFDGNLPDHLLQWLKKREEAFNAGLQPPETPNEQQTKSVDGKRNRNPQASEKRRKNKRGGRPGPEAQPGLGGA